MPRREASVVPANQPRPDPRRPPCPRPGASCATPCISSPPSTTTRSPSSPPSLAHHQTPWSLRDRVRMWDVHGTAVTMGSTIAAGSRIILVRPAAAGSPACGRHVLLEASPKELIGWYAVRLPSRPSQSSVSLPASGGVLAVGRSGCQALARVARSPSGAKQRRKRQTPNGCKV
jgi:hypothetical protein